MRRHLERFHKKVYEECIHKEEEFGPNVKKEKPASSSNIVHEQLTLEKAIKKNEFYGKESIRFFFDFLHIIF